MKTPDFLDYCDCNGDNMEEVCKENRCKHYKECLEFFTPIAKDLEKMTIGEI